MNQSYFNVNDCGARGDGLTLDTAAIQCAIDSCSAAGGGTVYFGPGKYLSGTLHLKSNIRLYLEAGSILLGSDDIADYNEIPRTNPEEHKLPYWFLLYGENLQNVTIEGRGCIDGQGREFWTEQKINHVVLAPKPQRPRSLLALFNCRDLVFRDVKLVNSACYTLWLVGCAEVNIDGLTILNPYDGPNTDALDIDCCQNVRVSNCHIVAGDDCIAIKSDTRLLQEEQVCENIVVSNCTLSSSACAIRLGYEGDAPIRNCTFNNIVVFDSDTGIDILSIVPQSTYCVITEGALIENVIFSNVVMANVNRPIFIWLGNEVGQEMPGYIKNIFLTNIIANARNSSYIGGDAHNRIESIFLQNIRIAMQGQLEEPVRERPGVWGGGNNPYALWVQNADDVSVRDLNINWEAATGTWEHQILCDHVVGWQLQGFRSQGFEAFSQQAPVCLLETSELSTA